jgi:ribosomal-protein-alanine N-acetyltransferase
MIAIVSAGRREAGALALLHGSSFAQGWTAEAFDRLLASPGTFSLLAREGGADVAFVLARVVVDEAEVLSVAVSPPARRRGIAAQILMAAAEEAARAGATRLFLEVGTENAAALALYRRLGFFEVGRRRGYYGDLRGDGLTMRVDLPLSRLGKQTEVD